MGRGMLRFTSGGSERGLRVLRLSKVAPLTRTPARSLAMSAVLRAGLMHDTANNPGISANSPLLRSTRGEPL